MPFPKDHDDRDQRYMRCCVAALEGYINKSTAMNKERHIKARELRALLREMLEIVDKWLE